MGNKRLGIKEQRNGITELKIIRAERGKAKTSFRRTM